MKIDPIIDVSRFNSRLCYIIVYLFNSFGSEPKLGSAQLGFGSSFWEKKLAMLSKKLGSALLGSPYLAKKLGSARLAPSFKKPNYL